MNDRVKSAKEMSQKRKRLIMQTCGMDSIEDLKSVLGNSTDDSGPSGAFRNKREDEEVSEDESKAKRSSAGKTDQLINPVEVGGDSLALNGTD